MNKKIKIIDLLNKIANGEEIPKKIKHWKEEYTLVNKIGFVSCTSKSGYCLDLVQCLNEEVEILEDNTEEIEELSDAEKKAIEKLKELISTSKVIADIEINKGVAFRCIEILINLTEKQSKEIEELKNIRENIP